MVKFLAYFRARVLSANMSKKGNDFTVIPRIAKQRNMYRTYTYGILLYYGEKSTRADGSFRIPQGPQPQPIRYQLQAK